MTNINKLPESQAQIRFQDCDPFNHLNNASYINYMINAREDHIIKHYDLDVFKMAKNQGISWVVGSNQIAYLRPAFTMEIITIQSQLIHFTNNELLVEVRMYNQPKTELKAVLWCSFVHFNLLKQLRTDHNTKLISLFNSIKLPVNQPTFEERVKFLKMSKDLAASTGL